MKTTAYDNPLLQKTVAAFNQAGTATIQKTVTGIISVVNDPDATINDLIELVEMDPPLAFNLLRVANSAYYSGRHPVTSIGEAVLRIGFEALKEIALSQKIFELFNDHEEYKGFSRIKLWQHSVAVAILGKMIYRMEFRERGDDIYAAGLLHEIGLVSEDQATPDLFRQAITVAAEQGVNLADAEQSVLGFHHAILAYAIAGSWQLPEALTVVIGYHHAPQLVPENHSRMVMVLFVADCLCQENKIGYCDAPHDNQKTYEMCLNQLNLEPYMLDLIVSEMKAKLIELQSAGLV